MSQPSGGHEPPATTSPLQGATPTRQAAGEEAGAVAQTVKQAGGRVASSATEEANQVLSEASGAARNLLGEARGQVRDQAQAQQKMAAARLRDLGDELSSMADHNAQPGLASELARQAGQRVQDVAEWLEQRDPERILDEVRGFARRRPGTFLLAAAFAGAAAGRLTRGAVAASKDQTNRPINQGVPSGGGPTQLGHDAYRPRGQTVPPFADVAPPPPLTTTPADTAGAPVGTTADPSVTAAGGSSIEAEQPMGGQGGAGWSDADTERERGR
jgi:hypothetical protein